jgi:hypothetical protein
MESLVLLLLLLAPSTINLQQEASLLFESILLYDTAYR